MNELQLISRAKLNWILQVGPPRPDRYHDIQTVFQELAIGEPMTFKSANGLGCAITGFPEDIAPESNLVVRAWDLMRASFPEVGGIAVKIEKSLPRGGGLGGGSSNAACTLRAINLLFKLNLTDPELENLGSQLGSDVAFFIRGGTATATGRGEILTPIPAPPTYHLVLVLPDEGMSTAEGYRLLDEISRPVPSPHTLSKFLTDLAAGDPHNTARGIENDFELVAQNFAWFRHAKKQLDEAGAIRSFLCGSGSTVAGLCSDSESAQRIALLVGGIPTYTWPMHI